MAKCITDLIHEGKGFHIGSIFTLADGATYTFIGTPDAIPVHFHDFKVSVSGGPVLIELIEAPTVSDAGDVAVAYNRKRGGPANRMAISSDATVSGGTAIDQVQTSGDTGIFGTQASGDGIVRNEWVLTPGVVYAIRLTNQTSPGADVSVSIAMDFYEELL